MGALRRQHTQSASNAEKFGPVDRGLTFRELLNSTA